MNSVTSTKVKRISNQQRSELSDERMFEAAVTLILEKGTEKTTLKEVGERAGYSRGLAGYRFGSKSGLFAFLIQQTGNLWLQYLTRKTKGLSGMDAIDAATDAHYKMLNDSLDNVRVFYILWFEALGDEGDLKLTVSGINQRRNSDLVDWITNDPTLVEKHDQAQSIAATYNQLISGIAYEYLLKPHNENDLKALHDNLKSTVKIILDNSI